MKWDQQKKKTVRSNPDGLLILFTSQLSSSGDDLFGSVGHALSGDDTDV